MIQIENALTELVKSYIKAEPNRSRGGIVALTGFEYQIWSYLADYALELSTNELLEGGQQFANAFETLSDYTLNSEMGIICVQVKHHLERRDMANAAAEFATIERFLESHPTFNLSNQFTYQVVARTGAKSLDWATIQLPQNIKNYQELCLYFDKIRGSGRLLTSRFEPDPHWKLIAAVYKHLADPFDFARRAFALCMRRTQEPNSAEFVRNTIAEDYKRGSRKHQPTSQPLSMSDFSRDPDGSGISLAKTPKISDLRCGRFMKRSERIADILVELDDIRKSNQGLNEPAISVLWINGRSGCGKSVLLLEIMEYLVVESQASVIWFANGTEEVGTIIDQMTKSDTSLRPDFLVVDDIYDPQARDSLDLPRLIRLIVHSDITTWPILITCGPTEFMQDFQSDSRAEGFRIIPFHLSTLEPTETTALQNWYHSRTGRLPELGFASTEQHALMISVMFELEYGDLKPFAYRFRQRLVQNQLDNVLNIPLALNRLYIWTPRQWLTPEEEERLERLNQDGDFSILSIEGKEQILFKLTHPHLSDAIYRALHPGATPVTFARHLVAAFSRALSSHLPTAVRLLRTVASNLSRLEIVDEKELANGMTTAWNTNNKVSLSPGMEVEMWINWAIWAARQPVVSTSFSELPLKTAIDMLYREHSRWSSLWLRLWMCALGEPALTNCALKWLASHFRDDGWQFVWYQVTKHLIQCARIMNVADDPVVTKLCLIGLRWSKKYTRKSGWSRVWEQLTDAPEFMSSALHDEVLRIGIEWTRENSNSVDWNFVWEKLAKMSHKQNLHLTSDEIYVIGSNWLKEHVNHPGWPFVWEHFIALSSLPNSITHQELLQMGITWISGRENDPGWGFIVLKLAEKGERKI